MTIHRVASLLLIGLLGSAPVQAASLADLMGAGTTKGAIPLYSNRHILVKKVPVQDSRVGRGFQFAPVDGRLDSGDYYNRVAEWPYEISLTAVLYNSNYSNGLHVFLADDEGFDAVQLRGTFLGAMYRDTEDFAIGEHGKKLLQLVLAKHHVQRHIFSERQRLKRVDFFYKGMRGTQETGDLSDASFLRIDTDVPLPDGEYFHVTGPTKAPDMIAKDIARRFKPDSAVHALATSNRPSRPLELKGADFHHLITPEQPTDKGLDAVTFRFSVRKLHGPTLVTLRVQDPVDTEHEVMGVDFVVRKPGDYAVTLDVPDQVFFPKTLPAGVPIAYKPPLAPPPVVWLSIGVNKTTTIENTRIALHLVDRDVAKKEAMHWRYLIMKSRFSISSEPRPWMTLRKGEDIREWPKRLKGKRKRQAESVQGTFRAIQVNRLLEPQNDIFRQYHEWIHQAHMDPSDEAWRLTIPKVEGAPEWAILLREGYQALHKIPAWWIANRRSPRGELGTGVNDDTDMLQEWAMFPYMYADLSEPIRDMGAKLGDLARERWLTPGLINRVLHSPHHSYEEGINQMATNAFWHYGDPVHLERAMLSAKSIEGYRVKGGDGHMHFYNTSLQASDVDNMTTDKYGIDGSTTPLLLHPAYEVAWYAHNPRATDFLTSWADAWIEHIEPGKWPIAIDVKTGKVVGVSATYAGSGGYRSQGSAFTAAYAATRDMRFLKFFYMATEMGQTRHLRQWGPAFVNAPPFLKKFRNKLTPASFGPTGYATYRMSKNKADLRSALIMDLTRLKRYAHIYTDAEMFTDRIFTRWFRQVVQCYMGAFAARNHYNHDLAVSYENFENFGHDFAALVNDTTNKTLNVSFFNFKDTPQKGALRVWRLEPGRYKVMLGLDEDDDNRIDRVLRERSLDLRRYAAFDITLPSKKICVLDVSQIKKYDDLRRRADLALSPLDSSLAKNGSVVVRVHNIGAKTAENITVTLTRRGQTIATRTIDALEAPLDLGPRIKEVTFQDAQPGDVITLDPDNAILEIAEHNNRLIVKESGFARPKE